MLFSHEDYCEHSEWYCADYIIADQSGTYSYPVLFHLSQYFHFVSI